MDVKPDFDHPDPDDTTDQFPNQPSPAAGTLRRRPRGFAAAGSVAGGDASAGRCKSRKEREKEKERTKLRERHRRAITSRMLTGLRQHGNFTLPARADMNDVLAALARDAGWTVEADGTTYRSAHRLQPKPPPAAAPYSIRTDESTFSATSLKNCSLKASMEFPASTVGTDEKLSPTCLHSLPVIKRDQNNDTYGNARPSNAPECLDVDKHLKELVAGMEENNTTESIYVPVNVMLPLGILNEFCQLVDPDGLRRDLRQLKSSNVDGVVVECWWGIVESWPQNYQWSGYRELFNIIREVKLKAQVVLAFHECGLNGMTETLVTLPKWILEVGKDNQDIFFTDREGRRNTSSLSWGIDKERVLNGRTAIEVYFDFMRSFRLEFDDIFSDGLISAVEVGLGPSGELQYPSFCEKIGWRYPGIGEFQCYDKYMQQSLRKAAHSRGKAAWASPPDDSGQYNSVPQETGFFCDRGGYDSYYGRFFLHWYSQALIHHADHILFLAKLVFQDMQIIIKIPLIYWWYKTTSHSAELTAGFYNCSNLNGYSALFELLKKHSAAVKFSCCGLQFQQESDEALADPQALFWQLLNSAWDHGVSVIGQNALPCFDTESYARIVVAAKPADNPDHHHFSSFTYLRMLPYLSQRAYRSEFDRFVKCMHGERLFDTASTDLIEH